MLFRVTNVSSENIDFYIVPDDPNEVPRAKIDIDGRIKIVDANQTMIDLIAKGRHRTGLCGFKVSIPELNTRRHQIIISDSATGLQVYRRMKGRDTSVKKRIILPQYWSEFWDISPLFLDKFVYHYDFEKDLKSSETLLEVTQNHCESVCVSGKVPIAEIIYELRDNLEFWAVISDPDEHWVLISKHLSLTKNIWDIPIDFLTQASDPLLKLIVNKDSNSLIYDDDIQSAYKILSHANLFCATSNIQWPNSETELFFPLIDRSVKPSLFLNNESVNFFKSTLMRNDINFYKVLYDLLND